MLLFILMSSSRNTHIIGLIQDLTKFTYTDQSVAYIPARTRTRLIAENGQPA